MIESVLEIICSLYPYIQPFVWLYPHLASLSIPERGTIPLSMDDLCHTFPRALIRVLSMAIIYGLTMPSKTNRHPIFTILSLISLEAVLRRLSKVRLLGKNCDSVDNPQALITLLLYGRSMERNSCNDLFESRRNQIRTIKHRRIIEVEYTYGLPRR